MQQMYRNNTIAYCHKDFDMFHAAFIVSSKVHRLFIKSCQLATNAVSFSFVYIDVDMVWKDCSDKWIYKSVKNINTKNLLPEYKFLL